MHFWLGRASASPTVTCWLGLSWLAIYHINSLILSVCVCVSAVFRCFHIEKSPSRPVSFAQWFSWGGGFLLSLISRLTSLWKCPNEHFGLLFRTPHTQEIDGLTLPGRPSTLIGCRPRIDAVLSPVFGKWPPKHAFDERSKNSVLLHANAQFRALEKPPFWPSFSTGALSFRECSLFGVQPVLAAFVTTLQLGTLPVWHSLKNVCSTVLPIADVGMAFSLAEDRGLSRSRFNRHSPGFNQHSPGFVCSVLRIADAGMAFSDRGLSRSRFNRPSPGFNRHSPVSFAPCFGSQMREWLSL